MNLADLTATLYIASNDYAVGTEFPPLEIERVDAVVPPSGGKDKTAKKGVVYFRGGSKGWMASKTDLRKIGQALEITKNIDKHWPGNFVALKVVGNVRRPDGTVGNAFRVAGAWKRGEQPEPKAGAASINDAAAKQEEGRA